MFPMPTKLEKDRVLLVVIDVQESFRSLIQGMPLVIAGCSRLIRFFARLSLPILVTEQYPQGLGPTLAEIRRLLPEFKPLEKVAFSCAGQEEFNHKLATLGRDQPVLCGIESHVCVYQTAFDLLSRGLQVTLAVDATSSRSARDREIALERLARLGAQNLSVEMILFEILRVAKTPDFKLVADILKE
jgi:nicotinamidase-related amidase